MCDTLNISSPGICEECLRQTAYQMHCQARPDGADARKCRTLLTLPRPARKPCQSGRTETASANDNLSVGEVTYAVSPDGQTLTETGSATGTAEEIKVVYDRFRIPNFA